MGLVKVVTVQLAPPYDVLIAPRLVERAGDLLRERLGRARRCFVVTSPPVRRAWGRKLGAALSAASIDHSWLEMPDGERHKNMTTVARLAARLVKAGADRSSVIVAFGGGVVGDTAAFLASVFMRGLDLVQVPTTLLAQIDSSLGGKTGVNLPAGKNLVGTFHQPRLVLTDPAVLATLPPREYRSGLFEALKCGVIADRALFESMEAGRDQLLARHPESLVRLIEACVKVKARVVEADEREAGQRRILNFGHTIGHALEADTAYRTFRHGEAVAWGMVAATRIAVATGKTDARTAERIVAAVLAYSPLPRVRSRSRDLLRRLAHDKKTRNGMVHFVLPVEIGCVEVVSGVPEPVVLGALDELRRLSPA